ncbi:hypothetical protein MPNTM1_04608 [Mycolicibacterium parafortuitum]|uniref:hypothetical protein n=1 Tax=Mycolicibacterium parafortuitum TaxID=39692 RepID=UPI0032C48D81
MSDANSGPDGTDTHDNNATGTDSAEAVDNAPDAQSDGTNDNSGGDTFPRAYVEDLRKESAGYRDRAKQAEDRADALAKRLHTALVTATNRLENPADLGFDAEHLDDADKLSAAIDALLSDRPYMAKRVVKGDAGQGPRGDNTSVSLLDMLKGAT